MEGTVAELKSGIIRSETLIVEHDLEDTKQSVEALRATLTKPLGEFAAPKTRASRSQGKSTGGARDLFERVQEVIAGGRQPQQSQASQRRDESQPHLRQGV